MRPFLYALLATVPMIVSPQAGQAESKEEIEKIVHDYILAHPEVMMESLENYQKKAMAEIDAKRGAAVKENEAALLHDKDTPSIGPENAKTTVVEFFDYNCSVCKMMFKTLQEFMKEHPDARVVLKEFPIFGEPSEMPAKIGIAVHRLYPDKYFDYHAALMGHEGRLSAPAIEKILSDLKMDPKKVKDEAASAEVAVALQSNLALAQKLGATGTPMFVLGDAVIPHAISKEELEAYAKAAGE